jgi:hypothetical protein
VSDLAQVPPRGVEQSRAFPRETQAVGQSDAKSDALGAQTPPPFDPDLQALIALWPDLPAELRAEILAVAHRQRL